jgi:hypothetical protein
MPMTDVPEHQTPAEAARRHAIAALRARLDEIAEHAQRAEASEDARPPRAGGHPPVVRPAG